MVVEVVVAVVLGSLALISDAGHMLTDAGAIGASLWAIRLAARPARGVWTFGWKRAEILSAAVNGLTLLVVGALVAFEAIRRLIQPPPVAGGSVLVVALLGVAVNLVAAWVLAKANRSSLNVHGAYQHILTDLYGFIATFLAGGVIVFTGFVRADAIASLIVVGLMFHAAWGLLRGSGRALLEAAPGNGTGCGPRSSGHQRARHRRSRPARVDGYLEPARAVGARGDRRWLLPLRGQGCCSGAAAGDR